MEVLEIKERTMVIEVSYAEFNLIRELESAVHLSCSKSEIPTLTGWTSEELLEFGERLSAIAEKNNIKL